MIRKFLKRLLFGAAAALATYALTKLAKKIFAPKEMPVIEEVAATTTAQVETQNEDDKTTAVVVEKSVAVVAPAKAPVKSAAKTQVLDAEYEVLVAEDGREFRSDEEALRAGVLPPEIGDRILEEVFSENPNLIWDKAAFQAKVQERIKAVFDAATAREAAEIKAELEQRQRNAEIRQEIFQRMEMRIEEEHAATGSYFPTDKQLQLAFRGVYADDLGFGRNARVLRPLIEKTVLEQTPGTIEFAVKYNALSGGRIPAGYLVPKRTPLMSREQETALLRQFQMHLERPMDLDKFEAWNEQQVQTEELLANGHRSLPDDWEDRIEELLGTLKEHFEGYTMDAEHDAMVYLTAIVAARNVAWGNTAGLVSEFIAPALFKYSVFCLRKLIYIEECQGFPGETISNEPIADAFEELLELLAIANPEKGEILFHTPMKRIGIA